MLALFFLSLVYPKFRFEVSERNGAFVRVVFPRRIFFLFYLFFLNICVWRTKVLHGHFLFCVCIRIFFCIERLVTS